MTIKSDRPNILCIVSEDCPPMLGAHGDALARTPHLDWLARQGVIYCNAFCTSPVCGPSRFAILTGRHAESCGPAHHMRSSGAPPPNLVTVPEMLRAAGYYCTNNEKTDYNCAIDPALLWDASSATAHWRDRPRGQPFFAIFNSMQTHESSIFRDAAGPVQPEAVSLPPHLPDTAGMRMSLARYYNAVERMDAELGARLKELEDDGLAEDTIVFYYSDHASPLPRSKRFCYDDGLRVPLVVRVPERWRRFAPADPGTRIDTPVSLVDLMPTLTAVAGCPVPPGAQEQAFLGPDRADRRFVFAGRDRMDERYDLTRTVRSQRFRYIRNYAPHRPWAQHYAFAWLSPAYRDYERLWLSGDLSIEQARFWRRKPAEEFYDCEADPHALYNLAEQPEYAAALDEMRAALDAHMIAINDMGFIPEFSALENMTASLDPIAYPIEAVIQLANLAIRGNPTDALSFMGALESPSMVLRYWGAQGLLILAVNGHALPDGVARHLARETSPHVQIPLAEALGHSDDPDASLDTLVRLLDQVDNRRVQLQALNALTYVPAVPQAALASVDALCDHSDPYLRGAAKYLKLKMTGAYVPESKIFRVDLVSSAALPLGAPTA